MTETPQTRLLAQAKRLLECYKRHGDLIVSHELLSDFYTAIRQADADLASLAERVPSVGWKSGAPPRFDDGRIILIVLHQPTSRNYAYGGAPIAVSCWTDRLKATCNDEQIDYDEVKEWIALSDLVSPE